MMRITGRYATATVHATTIEETAIQQIQTLCDNELAEGTKIEIMPDVHAGKGCTIGTTIRLAGRACPNLVGVDVGCVDKDTEFLSVDGWHKIEDYNGQPIAIYDLEKDITKFEIPNAFIKKPEDEFYYFKTKYGIDQMLSKEHKCLLRKGSHNRKNSVDLPYCLTAEEIFEKHNKLKLGFRDNFVCEIPNIETKGLNFTDNQIRLMVMYSADGSTKDNMCRFKKERKIERCKKLLDNEGIEYTESIGKDGTTSIRFNTEFNIKKLNSLYGLSKQQLAIVCDEVMRWDGNEDSMQYTSTVKENIDFVQYAFACNGYRTSIWEDQRSDKYRNGECYKVCVSNSKPRVQLAGNPKTPIEIVKSIDGFKYCFNTSTGYWVMRRNGCICVTGNCGMAVSEIEGDIDLRVIDEVIHTMPTGFDVWESPRVEFDLTELRCYDALRDVDRLRNSIGTLGSGNHFIEVNRTRDGRHYLVVHSGSRNLGVQVANHYQDIAVKRLHARHEVAPIREVIDRLTAEGRQTEIQRTIEEMRRQAVVTKEMEMLAYLDGQDLEDYLHDMAICQNYATLNRETIKNFILNEAGLNEVSSFTTIHNYIDTEERVLRKGAVSAKAGERLIIPMNMRDGSIIAIGKGNADWNESAPHGAGRLMSRKAARNNLSLEEYEREMSNVYTTSVSLDTIDEAPMAYKSMQEIVDNIKDTVDIEEIVTVVYNYKAN